MNHAYVLGCLLRGVTFGLILAGCSRSSTATGSAETSAPTTEFAMESCTRSVEVQLPAMPASSGEPPAVHTRTLWYAEHAYPGRTKENLAGRVRNWVHVIDGPSSASPLAQKYEWEPQFELYLRDGVAAVPCGSQNQTTMFIYSP
jgi:hypothetical protein